jgi:hypothetical protein
VPVHRRFAGGVWSGDLDLGAVPGQDVRAPTIAVLPNGRVVVAWTSMTGRGAGVEARAFARAGRE